MDANVTANCVHPGIVRTRLIRDRDGLITSNKSSSLLSASQLTSQRQLHDLAPIADTVFFLASKLLKTIPQVCPSAQLNPSTR
jgi:retinol dehydrogenase 12